MSKYFISYPSSEADNPFIKLLNDELAKNGWVENKVDNVWRNFLLTLSIRKGTEILYFHWPETFWRSQSLFLSCFKALTFIIHVIYWKLLGFKLVFSAHNVMPHFGKVNYRLERIMRKYMLSQFDLVVGHSKNTYDEVISYLGKPKKYVLCIHGIYENPQKPKPPNTEIRRLFIAYSNHDYKGSKLFFDQLLSFDQGFINQIELIITGNLPEHIKNKLIDKGIKFTCVTSSLNKTAFLSEDELRDTLAKSDIVVLPYKEITNSGFFFLALTMGKGVLSTDLPFFKLHSKSKMNLLYNFEDINSLKTQMVKLNNGWTADVNAIEELQQEYQWSTSAKFLAKSFNDIT